MKKVILIILSLSLLFVGCQKKYQCYSEYFIGPFDTVTTYITYEFNRNEFDKQCQLIEEKLNDYHQLFDRYQSYENINNVYTINQNAGVKPVVVRQELIDLIELSIQRYKKYSQKVNIVFGSVIDIWHTYREKAQENNGIGEVPSQKELEEASLHTKIGNIEVDKQTKTVYIKDNQMSLDLGATAKGYALELIKELLIEEGVDNFLLSGGGNVVSYGERKIMKKGEFSLKECQNHYCVGVASPQDGNFDSDDEYVAILIAQNQSIVTSGDYQRFYEDSNGVKYHHLIDPDTLYPASFVRSVSVIAKDSGFADFLSSTLFLMSFEEGKLLVESLGDVEAIWLLENGKIRLSSGLKDNQNIYVMNKERVEE